MIAQNMMFVVFETTPQFVEECCSLIDLFDCGLYAYRMRNRNTKPPNIYKYDKSVTYDMSKLHMTNIREETNAIKSEFGRWPESVFLEFGLAS